MTEVSTFKLLLVEDNDEDVKTCEDSIDRYNDEHKNKNIELTPCKTLADAFDKLNNTYDGAIIDLNLGNEDEKDAGNKVVREIEDACFRIPVVILTGTPNAVESSNLLRELVLKKGEPGSEYVHIFDLLWEIYNTGLTKIMGGRGEIEKALNTVFLKNLLPQKGIWVVYGKTDPFRTERALLRYTLNHLLQLLDNDEDRYFPEEMYLAPPHTNRIRTGSIIKSKTEENYFVVLTPACDLVIRGENGIKTDRILIAEIDSCKTVFPNEPSKKELEKAFRNNNTAYYHWLPKTNSFTGGFLNFRKLSTLPKEKIDEQFEAPSIQISPSFVKDVLARFSSYYARQGQPDINYTSYQIGLTEVHCRNAKTIK